MTCGPHAVSNKRRFPEAVLAAACLSASPGGAKSRPEGHLKLLLSLIEDSMDHPDIHSAVDRRSLVFRVHYLLSIANVPSVMLMGGPQQD